MKVLPPKRSVIASNLITACDGRKGLGSSDFAIITLEQVDILISKNQALQMLAIP